MTDVVLMSLTVVSAVANQVRAESKVSR